MKELINPVFIMCATAILLMLYMLYYAALKPIVEIDEKYSREYKKILMCIHNSSTLDHLHSCRKMIDNFLKKYQEEKNALDDAAVLGHILSAKRKNILNAVLMV